jgi:tetratricopeptide (TPR) repeat protein
MKEAAMPFRSAKLALLLSFLLWSVPAFAMGGGGGGGGMSAPSQSAPQYDPAEEYRKGIAALQAKDFKAARVAFDRVLDVAPRDTNTLYLAGVSRMGLNDWKGARKLLEKTVKLDATMINAQRDLGVTYAQLKDGANGAKVLATLSAMSDKCNKTCAQASELKSAIDAVKGALGGAPIAMVLPRNAVVLASSAAGDNAYLEAVSLINLNRFEDAITSLKRSKASFGPHPDILTYLGFANRKLGRFAVAEDYYHQALSAAPGHRGATEYYGELKVERGDLAGAKAMLVQLDRQCRFGCAEAEELRRWITAGHSPHS